MGRNSGRAWLADASVLHGVDRSLSGTQLSDRLVQEVQDGFTHMPHLGGDGWKAGLRWSVNWTIT